MLLTLIPLIFIALLAITATADLKAQPSPHKIRADAAAQSMAIYRQAVINWANANPAAPTQTVPDASLVFSYGYTKNFPWTNTVTAGHGWIYTSDSSIVSHGGMVTSLISRSDHSLFAGVNVGGYVWSPRTGATSLPVPATIPVGSLVWGF